MFRQLKQAQGGAVLIEFALWFTCIFLLVLIASDFAFFSLYKERLSEAVSRASLAAHASRQDIDVAKLGAYVTTAANLPGDAPTVTITCNGESRCVNDKRVCACLSADGQSFSPVSECATACPSGSLSGYYLTISARYRYSEMIMPNSWLDRRLMTAAVTVRLQ